MIIDCHGHYTTASPKLQAFRDEQLQLFSGGKDTSVAKMAAVSDDEITDSIVNNQLKLIKERGGDLTIFSPKASAMGQHQADLQTSIAWAKGRFWKCCRRCTKNGWWTVQEFLLNMPSSSLYKMASKKGRSHRLVTKCSLLLLPQAIFISRIALPN